VSPEITPRSIEGLVGFGLELGLGIVLRYGGGASFLISSVRCPADSKALIRRLRRPLIAVAHRGCLFDLGIRHLEQNGVDFHFRAGQDPNAE